MSTTYSARILRDSISKAGVRITTFEVVHPRFLLAEFNTHKMVSKNSGSSRAKPTEQVIDQVQINAFVPETFNQRVKGMGIGDALDETKQKESRRAWLRLKEHAVATARILNELGVDKSRVNRLLEPFMWHTAILTATDWDNFFALRCPPGDPDPDFPAQIEFQIAAVEMREALKASTPDQLGKDAWHLPLVSIEEVQAYILENEIEVTEWHKRVWPIWKMVSAGRCARVSYDKHRDIEPIDTTIVRAQRLVQSGHLSPFEHIARPLAYGDMMDDNRQKKLLIPGDAAWAIMHDYRDDTLVDFPYDKIYCGNLRGFWQMRKEIHFEENYALAVAHQEASA